MGRNENARARQAGNTKQQVALRPTARLTDTRMRQNGGQIRKPSNILGAPWRFLEKPTGRSDDVVALWSPT